MGQKRKRTDTSQEQAVSKPFQKKKSDLHNGSKGKEKKVGDGHKPKLTFEPRPDWHAAELPELPLVDNAPTPDFHILDDLHRYGETLLEAENAMFESSNASSSSHKFMYQTISSGTLEDKVSSLTLLVQESPIHTRKAFENLLGLASKRSRNQALMAIAALKDLLGQGVLLPPDRKLRAFNRQPALAGALKGVTTIQKISGVPKLPPGVEKVHLISWTYEDWLKKQYFELLKTIEVWCNDEVQYARMRSVTFVYELLKEKPEQEENLLRLLINKLGDTDKKIASRASYLLLQLQNSHPLMKEVIVSVIEAEFLFRPGQSAHARYNAVVTLNQTILGSKEQEVSDKLLEIYFKLFLGLIKDPHASEREQGGGSKPGKMAKEKAKRKESAAEVQKEADEKMIAQILTGINRAFPYAKTDDEAFESKLDMIYRVTHASNFNTSLQALILLQQISATKHFTADRFYRTLYESLLDPRLTTTSKHILYLNLLYRALKSDMNPKRVQAFVKRLMQIITLHEPPFACGVLFLINELIITFPSIREMMNSPEEDDEEEVFMDAPETEEDAMAMKKKKETQEVKRTYDGRKRDPQYANANLVCLWELIPFKMHFHPSVSLFASRLLYGEVMPPKPDPSLHTLMHFLDRFSYRNPKANALEGKGTSIFQPLAGSEGTDRLIKRRSGAFVETPLNTEAFWSRKAADVAADEVFFHKYFSQSGKKVSKDKKARKSKKDDDEDSEEEAGEEEIWKALVQSKPEIEGDEDSDDGGFDDEDMLSDDDDADDSTEEAGGVELNLDSDSDAEDLDDAPEMDVAGSDEEEDDFDMAELEDDEDDIVGSDDELPSDFEEAAEGADEEEVEQVSDKKKARDEKKAKKRKLKSLPTFASADDYAKLMQDDEDGF
ncbi:CBF-domain-containing protein [Pseudovirgaria hyperparasitica]|uniref:CBF-domain-containing protein n=1 Tax=Pseudovirgaria hyperparasitica TaxID=470096 RepID=A0A6A6WIQ6_9PEZI|nr:CBF-domain-containing protein [Pseudovirgaria hyperparasitica]KAF2761946.1 CBF-domain-containing protein [Pseudovirgaria hyperparasitica]